MSAETELADMRREVEAWRELSRLQAIEINNLRHRSAHQIPSPFDVTPPTYVVPLLVGRQTGLFSAASADQPQRHYQLVFVRKYSDDGAFWELAPFATIAERIPRR